MGKAKSVELGVKIMGVFTARIIVQTSFSVEELSVELNKLLKGVFPESVVLEISNIKTTPLEVDNLMAVVRLLVREQEKLCGILGSLEERWNGVTTKVMELVELLRGKNLSKEKR
jgi:hypothetical protein